MTPSMPTLTTKVRCPYCGDSLALGDCPIVATATSENGVGLPITSGLDHSSASMAHGQPGPDEGDEEADEGYRNTAMSGEGGSGKPERDKYETISRQLVLRWTDSGWPVVAEGPLTGYRDESTKRRKASAWLRGLPPVEEKAAPEDLPARACSQCGRPLPIDIGVRPLKVLAVIGTIGAGKTHFLASALSEAYHDQSLSEFGYSEFFPDEATSFRIEDELFEDVIRAQARAGRTETSKFDYVPLCFRVSIGGSNEATVLIHNIPGEVLMNRSRRAQYLPFLRRADGLIFLIDPKFLPKLESLVEPDRLPPQGEPQRGFHQTRLFNECLGELEKRRDDASRKPFVSAVISKADVVPGLLGRPFTFAGEGPLPSDQGAWEEDRKTVEGEVREVLAQCGTKDLLAKADQWGKVVFQAVAPIGAEAAAGSKLTFMPVRCTEVLAAALDGMMGVEGRNWSP